jgi:hypothetical protein
MRRHSRELVEKLGRRELALIIVGAIASAVAAKLLDVLL